MSSVASFVLRIRVTLAYDGPLPEQQAEEREQWGPDGDHHRHPQGNRRHLETLPATADAVPGPPQGTTTQAGWSRGADPHHGRPRPRRRRARAHRARAAAAPLAGVGAGPDR